MATTDIDTRRAERRSLRLASLADLRAELDRLEAAHDAGTLRSTGNWTTAEQCDHLAKLWAASFDGFPSEFRPALVIRLLATFVLKGGIINGKPLRPGVALPQNAAFLHPEADIPLPEGLARLRRCIDRTDAGDAFVDRSPVFGKLDRDDWIALHLNHASMHLSFSWPE